MANYNDISQELNNKLQSLNLMLYPFGTNNSIIIFEQPEDDGSEEEPQPKFVMQYYRNTGEAYMMSCDPEHFENAEAAIRTMLNL